MGAMRSPVSPIPSPTLPLKGRESRGDSSPFKGEVGRGMGSAKSLK